MKRNKLLEIKGLKTRFKIGKDWAKAVDGIDFDIYNGEILGIVGESGSGKSVSVLSLIQLVPNPPGEVTEGEIIFKGEKIFDGKDLARVKQVPKYRFFPRLSENLRNGFALLFFIFWLVLHSSLGIPGFLPFIISVFLDSLVTRYVFYNSPFKKAMAEFRENMYKRMRVLRGREVAMIFQEPMTSLNPVFTVGMQMVEALYAKSFKENLKDWVIGNAENIRKTTALNRLRTSGIFAVILLLLSQFVQGWSFHAASVAFFFILGLSIPSILAFALIGLDRLISQEYHELRAKLLDEAAGLLSMVGIPAAERRLKDYPHQFSGGMRQRAMIAMALAKNPSLLIADEPTTALDVTIQAQILELMIRLKEKRKDAAVVLITHDLAVIAETCERVIVMYGGIIQEVAEVDELFDNPLHPYTNGLLSSIPRPDKEHKLRRLGTIPGMVPNILNLPVGCKFCTRCEQKIDICDTVEPLLEEIRPNHFVRCHVTSGKSGGSA